VDTASHADRLDALKAQLGRVILGKPEAIENITVCLLAGGHILMEDVPGVGKTTLAKALARSLSADFKRVQFTPDLLPTDILGSSVYSPKDGSFSFKPGPIFTNVLLADEINRASPRTQSSLLEAMSERQVSIEGTTHPLPAPFVVIATQNPVEFHGTYPLPEAQLDRFGMRINLGYPANDHEVDVLYSQFHHHPLDDVTPVLDAAAVVVLQEAVRAVVVERSIGRYIVALADATRRHPSLRMGCSPRGALSLFRVTQARAFVSGRTYAVPEDVKSVAVPSLAHRLALDTRAKYSGVHKEALVREVLEQVPVGV
jgi:MoxR-like ATPase